MSTQLHGIAGFVRRLEIIAQECGEQKAKPDQPKDEFLKVKQRIYTLLEQARSDIHDRQSVLKKRGNCYETIHKGQAVRQALDELKQALPRLQELHKKAQNRRSGKVKKDELQARYQDIRVLKRHIDELNELYLSGQELPPEAAASFVAPKFLGLRDSARANPEDARRDMTSEESDALAAMKRRDADIENQVEEVGLALNRLDPLARTIGATAERQRLRAEALTAEAEKTGADIEQINRRVTEIMRYEKNTNMCCQIGLGVVLFCCVGFVIQQLT